LAIVAAFSCALFTVQAAGQGVVQPATVKSSNFTTDYYQQDKEKDEGITSPSDVPPSCGKNACDGGCDGGCDGRCGRDCCGGCGCRLKGCLGNLFPCHRCASAEAWTLFPQDDCRCGGWKVGGWMEGGITFNADTPPSRFNGPVAFNDRDDEAMLNQLIVYLDKPLDAKCGWDWGGRVELLYGRDALFIQSVGLELDDDGSSKWNNERFYGVALPQAYGEIGYGDVSVKLGKFVTMMEYEVIAATGNFFYSHSYGFLYAVPFTHTGGLVKWQYSDQLTLIGGAVNGWDRYDSQSDRFAFHGSLTWTSCDERSSVAVSFMTGDEDGVGVPAFEGNRTAYGLVLTHMLSDNLTYVLVHDLGTQEGVTAAGEAEWYTLANYLLYTINDCWTAGLRFECFRDDDGFRVVGLGNGNNNDGPFVGNFYEVTCGLNWTPNANLRVRPELRWDWFNDDGGSPAPYDDGTKNNQFTAAIDAILTF
jgi:hypothetical protein